MKDNLKWVRSSLESFEFRTREAMLEINQASLLALVESEVIDCELGHRLAAGLHALREQRSTPQLLDEDDYLAFEKDLVAEVGEDASWIHVGRSRQDIYSTIVHFWLRDGLTAVLDDLQGVRRALLATAQNHQDTLVPTFTHGVQAQPTTFAHYLLSLGSSFERMSARGMDAFPRVNQCPLGSGVLATSRFPLSRERMAKVLGFDDVRDNAYDANHMGPVDSALEVAAICSSVAVLASQLAQDLHTSFHGPKPWFKLGVKDLDGTSSMMPQKRNPRVLEFIREYAAIVLGGCQTSLLLAHNTSFGMTDLREGIRDALPIVSTCALLRLVRQVFESIEVDVEAARSSLDQDYSTMTQLSENLLEHGGISFRQAHHFASRLTDTGRELGVAPNGIDYSVVSKVYTDVTAMPFPMSETEYSDAIDPANFVATRKGRGGPQAAEVERMMAVGENAFARDQLWLSNRRKRLAEAQDQLASAFEHLRLGVQPSMDAQ